MSDKLGIKKNVRNPGSIVNIQHHDATGAQKNLGGSAAQIESIVAASTTATPIPDETVLRICNTTGSDQYIFVGRADQVPVTLNATNSLIIHGQTTEYFFSGCSDDESKSLAVKTSSNSVQVAIMK